MHAFQQFFHTVEEFDATGLLRFQNDVRSYFANNNPVPIAKAPSVNSDFLQFAFTDNLLLTFIREPAKIKKPYEVALKYGFRGFSKGGKNGIFYIRKEDDSLLDKVQSLRQRYECDIKEFLETTLPEKVRPVKIVYHSEIGERIIGLMNEERKKSRILFLDYARY